MHDTAIIQNARNIQMAVPVRFAKAFKSAMFHQLLDRSKSSFTVNR